MNDAVRTDEGGREAEADAGVGEGVCGGVAVDRAALGGTGELWRDMDDNLSRI